MAIFSSSAKTSKRLSQADTPRGSGQILSHLSTPAAHSAQGRQPSNNSNFSPATSAPEKTGHGNSPPLTLSSMEAKPPTGRYAEKGCLLDQKPESMVAESLRMKGELEFTRLLRVDGRFEGDLLTDKGSLVVGPKGEVIGDLKNMQEVYVEGIVRGNVFAHDVKVKNNGMLFGDIQCLCLTLDPTASIKGVADTATLKERAILEANPAPPSASSAASTTTAKTSAATSSTASSAGPAQSPPSISAAATHRAAAASAVKKSPAPSAIVATSSGAMPPPPSSGVARSRPSVEDTLPPSDAAPSPAS